MLMVGETVLQLVLAEPNDDNGEVSAFLAQVVHVFTLISGFAISVSMLYSFNIKEPHHARGHAYAHSSTNGIAFTLLYMLKACAVLLTGIGVKLAIYNPFSSPDEPSQRKQFAVSIAVCFGLQLVMRPLHSGNLFKFNYNLFQAPKRALVVFLRICTVGGMLALIAAPLRPALHVVAQALLALLENQLSRAEPKSLEEDDEPATPRRVRASVSGKFNSLMVLAKSPRTSRAARFSSRTSSFSGIVVERRKANIQNTFGAKMLGGCESASRVKAKVAASNKPPPPTPSAGPPTTGPVGQKRMWPTPENGDENGDDISRV